jgi:hypothetical protein
MSNEQFPVSVYLYESGGTWIAQGLEYDIVASGPTSDEASKNFNQKFGAELAISMEMGDPSPLSGVPRAPQEFWDRYRAIKKTAIDESRVEVRNGQTSRVLKTIKIAA